MTNNMILFSSNVCPQNSLNMRREAPVHPLPSETFDRNLQSSSSHANHAQSLGHPLKIITGLSGLLSALQQVQEI